MKKITKIILFILNIVTLCFAIVTAANSASYDNKTVAQTLTIYDDNGGSTDTVVFLGETVNLVAITRPANTKNINITWSSTNENVAKVNNGVVTTLKKGSADIIAISSGMRATYKITVADENSTYEYNGTTYNYVWEKGTWGNNIKWYYCVGKKLIITGKGDMQEPPGHVSQIPWLDIDDSSSIIIQEGITSICTYAFGAMEACEIKIPSTITKIGKNAFYCFKSQSNWQKWYFGGTPAQWNNIDIGPYNDGLPSVPDEYCRASGHIYKVTSTTQPTCTLSGYTNYTCECGDGYTANRVNALGHDYISKIIREPTHLTEGVEVFTCACGNSYTSNIEKIKEHTYTTVVIAPTCTTKGYTTYTCACGDTYFADYTDKLDHEYTSEITTEPTHLKEGVKTFTCACGDTYTEPVAKLEGHTYTSEVTKEATHLEEGETTYTCECGDSYTEVIAKLTGHTYKKAVTAPTCTAQGYTTYTCECGDTYVADYTDKLDHEYTSEITTEPTHLKEGETTYTCACGDSYTEVIEKIAKHNYKEDVTAPTCTAKGYTTYTCECGDIYVADYTEAKGHIYSVTTTQPTCIQNGLVTTFCTSCGDTHTETLEPTGHSFAEGSSKCENCDFDKADGCSCNCHKGGISGLIFKIILFFQRIFKTNKTCACGIAHY